MYAAEVWGLNRLDHIENVHLLACKRFLGVPRRTSNKMVYGELARFPLYVNSFTACIRYWLSLLRMNDERLPHKAYIMLLELDKAGKQCWASKVREILCLTGFSFVWLQQGVGQVKGFLKEFKHRLIDMYIQEWTASVRDSKSYDCYRTFKTVFEKERYILDMDTYCFRVAITQIRLNALPLNNNIYRYDETERKKLCPFCKTHKEDEEHFLFRCPLYRDLRNKFLKQSADLPIHTILEASQANHRFNLSRFVFHAINQPKKALRL